MGGHATTGVVAMRVSVGWRQRLSRALALPPGCGPWFSASVCLGWRNRPDHCRDQARCAKEPHKGPEFDGADAVFACRRAAKLPSDSRLRAAVACMSNNACGVRLARRRGACCGSGVHSVCLRAGARSAAVMFTYRCAAPCARSARTGRMRPVRPRTASGARPPGDGAQVSIAPATACSP